MRLVKDLGLEYPTDKSRQRTRYGIYECEDCKTHIRIQQAVVKRGQKSCKSCSLTDRVLTHGKYKHKLYSVYTNQKHRCSDKGSYGKIAGRIFSEEFLDFNVWLEYIEGLDDAYKEQYSIDRIDNNKGYERGNLRWASKSVQTRNTARSYKNNKSGYRGVYSYKNTDKFYCQITVDSNRKHLGIYNTKEEAAKAYDKYVLDNNLEHTRNFA